ncbi:MAG: hypothetical protein K5896_07610 [Prevotella sp.]|nr:hypothetical protein [Prevotella sp.]
MNSHLMPFQRQAAVSSIPLTASNWRIERLVITAMFVPCSGAKMMACFM